MDKINEISKVLINDNGSSALTISIDIIILILGIIFFWKIFKKAGEKGWKALIPVYNTYILFKISWKKGYFWFFLALAITMFVGIALVGLSPKNLLIGGIGTAITIGSSVGLIIIYINLLSKICYSFNKGGLFMLGLLFLSVIFYGILAFDKSEYIGLKTK